MSGRNNQRTSVKKLNTDEGRDKRRESTLEIRKNKKDDLLQKKRNFSDDRKSGNSGIDSMVVKVEEIPQYKMKLLNEATVLEGVIAFRKLLSIERQPPINQVLESGVVPKLISFLSRSDAPKLQFEAAWAVTNIASGNSEQTLALLNFGAAQIFIQLLSSPDEELREQAVWALGNIAGDSPRCRDIVLQYGCLVPLLNTLSKPISKITMLRNATWLLSNLCRGKPPPPFEMVSISLPILTHLLQNQDTEVMTDACWAFSYLSDGPDSNITAVLRMGITEHLVKLLGHSSFAVQTPALRAIGNIVTGNEEQTAVVLHYNVLPYLFKLLQSTRVTIKKEAAWALSNIAASNKLQAGQIIDANIFPTIIKFCAEAEYEVRKECAWVISNATTWKDQEQIRYLVALGSVKPIVALLDFNDQKLILICLEAIENILITGEESIKKFGNSLSNPYISVVEECDGIEKINALQDHDNTEIYEKAVSILEKFFQAEDEVVGNLPNTNTNTNTYNFSPNVNSNTNFVI